MASRQKTTGLHQVKRLKNQFKIGITTGDKDGIGLEVTLKALSLLFKSKSQLTAYQFIIWCDESQKNLEKWALRSKIPIHFLFRDQKNKIQTISNLSGSVVFVLGSKPTFWVEEGALFCLDNQLSALVTGPISKTQIKTDGKKDLGHTDIFKRLSRKSEVFMTFIGSKFNMILLTGHIGISSVAKNVLVEKLLNAKELVLKNPNLFDSSKTSKTLPKRFKFLGVNPHSGEEGLIGTEELRLNKELLSLNKNRVHFIPPDTAFTPNKIKKGDIFFSWYHDQGLIPFKALHGLNDGVHVSLGLPFWRTSVDHGTAKDIFGLNKANPSSMLLSIKLAMKLSKSPPRL